jgi:hypothetical protein
MTLSLDTLQVESFVAGGPLAECETSNSLACTNPQNTCCSTRAYPCPHTYACPVDPP